MPKENKRRGRREEKKRKRQEVEEVEDSPKRQRVEEHQWDTDEIKLEGEGLGYSEEVDDSTKNVQPTQEFYGLLDEDEQAYFKRAAQMLDLNEFVTGSTEERDAFLAGVWRECKDKELKVASSQSVSRFMEKLIKYATSDQLKTLFQAFSGHFPYLVQHRFASHCCEALFQRAAPLVTEELLTPFQVITADNQGNAVSTESLFVGTVSELKGSFGYLMTDSFASHSVRILLLVLSGRPLASQSTQSLLQSKKKETKTKSEKSVNDSSRAVPASFQEALDNIVQDMIGSLDTSYLRTLATHPLANPVLQLLLEIEFSAGGKQKTQVDRSLFNKLFPDSSITADTDSARFVRGLMYDPVGSHLLETVLKNCPGKVFKPIWNTELRPKISSIIKNDSAIHILARAIERLSPEDLQETINQVLPEIPSLLERLQFSILQLMIDRSVIRKLDTKSLLGSITDYYKNSNLESILIPKQETVKYTESEEDTKASNESKNPTHQRLSVFIQTMLDYQGSLRSLILDTISDMDATALVSVAKDRYTTFILQKALSSGDRVFRRIVAQKLSSVVVDMALHESASHVLESLWTATVDLQFLREKIAQQLATYESQIRDSYCGRFVWRSWMMDLFTRRRLSWIEKSKQADHVNQEGPVADVAQKSGIEAARERFAAKKAHQRLGFGNSQRHQRTRVT